MGRKIGLLNHMSGGNLGDSATQDVVIQNIVSRWPDSEIFGFSMNPNDTRSRHGIVSYPIRTTTLAVASAESQATVSVTENTREKAAFWWVLSRRSTTGRKVPFFFQFLKAIKNVTITAPAKLLYRASRIVKEISFLGNSFQILRSFDVLIISGGGQLLDACGGPWKFPYTIFKWTALSKLSGAKCYFLNVGAGPLDHRLGKWFVKSALRLADHVSFRDDDSRALVEDAGVHGQEPSFRRLRPRPRRVCASHQTSCGTRGSDRWACSYGVLRPSGLLAEGQSCIRRSCSHSCVLWRVAQPQPLSSGSLQFGRCV